MWLKPHAAKIGRRYATGCNDKQVAQPRLISIALGFNPMQFFPNAMFKKEFLYICKSNKIINILSIKTIFNILIKQHSAIVRALETSEISTANIGLDSMSKMLTSKRRGLLSYQSYVAVRGPRVRVRLLVHAFCIFGD